MFDLKSTKASEKCSFFHLTALGNKLDLVIKIDQGQPRVNIYINFEELVPRCHIPSFKAISPVVLEKKMFEGFYHIREWQPSWQCDLDQIYIFFLLLPVGWE